MRESLGRVLWLGEDKKSGIFLSPDRGLVFYDAREDRFEETSASDPRLEGSPRLPEPVSCATFGDVYLLTTFLRSSGLLAVFRETFPSLTDYERLLAHLVHSFLKDGSHIKCDTFIEQSAISFALPDLAFSTLRCDTPFFERMGKDDAKLAFFHAFVDAMRREDPAFGRACYVDSTPLPNDIRDNPYTALRCQRGQGCLSEMRLALVLDEKTGLPVWYEVFAGNRLDLNTLFFVRDDVASTLGIEICSFVLDSGYVSEELIRSFPETSPTSVLSLMPARTGYPYRKLYEEYRDEMNQPEYDFMYDGHPYFGRARQITLFETEVYACVMVDKVRALEGYEHFRRGKEKEFRALDHDEQRWKMVEGGYFILLSNRNRPPEEMLQEYRNRIEIESVFKTSKSFLGLLPLSKWSDVTVRGKLLLDMMETIVRVSMQGKLDEERRKRLARKNASPLPSIALMDIFHECAANICFRESGARLRVDVATKQVREAYQRFGYSLPQSLSIPKWKDELFTV